MGWWCVQKDRLWRQTEASSFSKETSLPGGPGSGSVRAPQGKARRLVTAVKESCNYCAPRSTLSPREAKTGSGSCHDREARWVMPSKEPRSLFHQPGSSEGLNPKLGWERFNKGNDNSCRAGLVNEKSGSFPVFNPSHAVQYKKYF